MNSIDKHLRLKIPYIHNNHQVIKLVKDNFFLNIWDEPINLADIRNINKFFDLLSKILFFFLKLSIKNPLTNTTLATIKHNLTQTQIITKSSAIFHSHKENSWDNTFQIQLWKYVDISVKYTDRLIRQIDR